MPRRFALGILAPMILALTGSFTSVSLAETTRQEEARLEATLRRLPAEDLANFLEGASTESIWLSTGESFAHWLERLERGVAFEIVAWSLDGGGGTSRGGAYELHAAVGQPDPGTASGGPWQLRGGLFADPRAHPCEAASNLFCDGFESGDASRWSDALGRR